MLQSTPFRRVVLAIASIMLALLSLAACGEDPVNDTNFAQLKPGMTLGEVETIMGGPGEREAQATGMSISGAGVASVSQSSIERYVWKSRGAMISVDVQGGKITNVGRAGF